MTLGAAKNGALVSLGAVAILFGVVACDSGNKSSGAPTASASAIAPFDYLPIEVTWKNKPLKIASALAFSRGGDALHVTLSTHPLSCADMRRGVQRHPGEVNLDLTLAPLLSSGGEEPWSITRARFGEITRQGKLAPVELSTFNPSETVKTELDVTLPFPPDQLKLKGELDVTGCGLMPRAMEAKVIRQDDLKVSLAGKTLVMNGATLTQTSKGERQLRISTEPLSCRPTIASDAVISLTLPPEGNVPSAVRAEGYILPRPLVAEPEEGAMTVAPATPKQGRGGSDSATDSISDPRARFDLKGELALSGYPLVVEGRVVAQRCK